MPGPTVCPQSRAKEVVAAVRDGKGQVQGRSGKRGQTQPGDSLWGLCGPQPAPCMFSGKSGCFSCF